ncbi:MAG TPA: DUF5668 domain-containing protein [Candidatus Limnocylindria bacterium]|nr:DUF5668 domain-containing protein [Candidatus Limnocylindria bacterium]
MRDPDSHLSSFERRAQIEEQRLHPLGGRLIVGVLVLVVGVVFMLDNLNLLEAGAVLRWWPLLLVTYGAVTLAGIGQPSRPIKGAVIVLIGGWLLLNEFNVVTLNPWQLWPVLLVALGISIVSGAFSRSREGQRAEDVSAQLRGFALMGGIQRRIASKDFRGGEVTAIMGGYDIDLRSAQLAEGNAVIDGLVLMGGVDLFVPEGWKVSGEALALLGGFEDKSKTPVEPTGHLVIKGLVVMGGVEIKN